MYSLMLWTWVRKERIPSPATTSSSTILPYSPSPLDLVMVLRSMVKQLAEGVRIIKLSGVLLSSFLFSASFTSFFFPSLFYSFNKSPNLFPIIS
jgi:hypothetical protein